jgi:hypothetical protein
VVGIVIEFMFGGLDGIDGMDGWVGGKGVKIDSVTHSGLNKTLKCTTLDG